MGQERCFRHIEVLNSEIGEYTVGIIPSESSKTNDGTDKKLGVVALTMLDLKRRGKLKWLGLCGTSAEKVNKAQAWLHEGIGKTYTGLNTELDALYPRANTDRYACGFQFYFHSS